MARRRMIDPNIWASEDMAKLSIRQRLLVIGLFSNADDYGKGKAKPAYIRSTIFPYDDIQTPDIIDDLETIRAVISVEFYEVEGNSYYQFSNWKKWQTVQKPQASIIPDQVENDSLLSPEPFSPKGKEEKGKEDKGETDSIHSSFNNENKDRIHRLAVQCELKGFNLFSADDLFDFIPKVEMPVIEYAIKKAYKKHQNYALGILKDLVENGKTTMVQIGPLPQQAANTQAENEQRLAEERKNLAPQLYAPDDSLKEVAAGYGPGARPTGTI